MRGLADPDVFLGGDLVLRQALDALSADPTSPPADGPGSVARPPIIERAANELASAWRPWRSYAVMHLWTHQTATRKARTTLAPQFDSQPSQSTARRIA